MPLSVEDLRFAVNDARERHKATVDLIGRIDQQALSLLQLYVTLAGAALSGAGVILLSAQSGYPRALGFGLIGFAAPLVFGAVLCVATIWPAAVNLPGRDPDFWLWATHDGVQAQDVYRSYLEALAPKAKQNVELNLRMSRLMLVAKIAGIAAPLLGAFGAAIAMRSI
ncbi:hypothetical protein JQ604_09970 [Bradyrhizobium jicamae]|uniref:hypothetical protein n=1 Tax=Bradyrhizobium jicamae TaxID=280332 RepID=UPI001BA4C7ED|nr:hypothetical protein [Bradyrhizobium jicamae]MBR0752513.1 hypothetical protein [Bradyrhizobium jicamae]